MTVSQCSVASSMGQHSIASSLSQKSQASNSSHHSGASEARAPSVSEHLTQAEADLAAGHARLKAVAKEENDHDLLAKLEERRRMDDSIVEQRRKLKMLKAESEINVGSANVKALQAAINHPPSATITTSNHNQSIVHQQTDSNHSNQDEFVNHQPFISTHKEQEQSRHQHTH